VSTISLIELLRTEATIGKPILLWLTNGREYSGNLAGIYPTFVVLETTESKITVLEQLIGGWQLAVAPASANCIDTAHSEGDVEIETTADRATKAEGPRERATESENADGKSTSLPAIRIAEIRARYDVGTLQLDLPMTAPDFYKPLSVSGLSFAAETKYRRELDRAHNQYQHAVRIREFSRLMDTAATVRNLITEPAISKGVRLLAGKILFIGGYYSNAKSLFEEEWR
jgi:small nuclear ribonucleoprotein (snRNP)-like protein